MFLIQDTLNDGFFISGMCSGANGALPTPVMTTPDYQPPLEFDSAADAQAFLAGALLKWCEWHEANGLGCTGESMGVFKIVPAEKNLHTCAG